MVLKTVKFISTLTYLGILLMFTGCSPSALPDGGCAQARGVQAGRCAEMAQKILAATVRLEVTHVQFSADGSYYDQVIRNSHATVVGEQYLVTHNHFHAPLAVDPLPEGHLVTLDVYQAGNNQLIIDDYPHQALTVSVVNDEVLVLDFGQVNGRGLFYLLGVDSAEVAVVNLRPGDEVAQVNWDNHSTRVDWVTVTEVSPAGNVAIIKLDNQLEDGASGGGIFVDGRLIGNNWLQEIWITTDERLPGYSKATLHPVQLVSN